MVLQIIKEEIQEIREKHGDERRTEIIDDVEEIDVEDLIAEEDMVVTISHEGYIKRNPISLYRAQRRGGKGSTGVRPKAEDFVELLFVASSHDYLLFFTNRPGLLAQGPRDSGGRADVAGQGHRQPAATFSPASGWPRPWRCGTSRRAASW